MYGPRSYKKFTSSRSSRGSRGYSSSSYGKMAKRSSYARKRTVGRPKFALAGYARDTERKYFDKAMMAKSLPLKWDNIGHTMGLSSDGWTTTLFPESNGGGVTGNGNYKQDLVKGIPQGTNVSSRIGNKINVKYIKGTITLSANRVRNETSGFENAQYGESEIWDPKSTNLWQYIRTTYRVVIVRDLQVNSQDNEIKWDQVFANSNGTAGVHAELNVGNMGRFRVCMDKLISLDSDDPQKTMRYQINNVGPIRYNGPQSTDSQPSLTDNGYYIIWANISAGVATNQATASGGKEVVSSAVLVNNRVCFTDE